MLQRLPGHRRSPAHDFTNYRPLPPLPAGAAADAARRAEALARMSQLPLPWLPGEQDFFARWRHRGYGRDFNAEWKAERDELEAL